MSTIIQKKTNGLSNPCICLERYKFQRKKKMDHEKNNLNNVHTSFFSLCDTPLHKG